MKIKNNSFLYFIHTLFINHVDYCLFTNISNDFNHKKCGRLLSPTLAGVPESSTTKDDIIVYLTASPPGTSPVQLIITTIIRDVSHCVWYFVFDTDFIVNNLQHRVAPLWPPGLPTAGPQWPSLLWVSSRLWGLILSPFICFHHWKPCFRKGKEKEMTCITDSPPAERQNIFKYRKIQAGQFHSRLHE